MKPPALKPQTLARLAEGWRPYRSIAAWYLWRLLELPSVESSGELARLPVKRRK
jgi:3-methyladenine DNA glycosylase/8-oxoguanine DNA glycosylase